MCTQSRTKKSNVHYPPSIGITAPTTTASCLAMLESTTGQCADSNPVSGDYPVMTRHPEIRTTAQLIVGIPTDARNTPSMGNKWRDIPEPDILRAVGMVEHCNSQHSVVLVEMGRIPRDQQAEPRPGLL